MIVRKQVLGLGLLSLILGCGSPTVSDNPVDVEQTSTPLKTMLEEVAASGELGSTAMTIRDAIEGMRATGDVRAADLIADLDDLEKTGDSKLIKKKAAAMIKKL